MGRSAEYPRLQFWFDNHRNSPASHALGLKSFLDQALEGGAGLSGYAGPCMIKNDQGVFRVMPECTKYLRWAMVTTRVPLPMYYDFPLDLSDA